MASQAGQPAKGAGGILPSVAWLTAQSLGSKLVQVASLAPLAWLLSPGDFGLIGLVSTVAAFAALAQQAGIKEVLIQRGPALRFWAGPAVRISLVAGLLGAALVAGFAPLAPRVWGNPQLPRLLLVLALATPLQAMSMVPEAQLHLQMRFKLLAIVGLATSVGQTLLVLLLAWAGAGALAFVLPVPLAALARCVAVWSAASLRLPRRRRPGSWRRLLAGTGVVFATNLSYVIVAQGDYAVLGAMTTEEATGFYFLAFNLAAAPLQIFGGSLTTVLFPAFGRLGNAQERQLQTFWQVTRSLALALMPVLLLQAALARPLFELLLEPKWAPAIPLAQILSVGMMLRCVGWPSASLLQAQGRFPARLGLAVTWAVALPLAAVAGTALGGVAGAAVGVALLYSVVGPVTVYVAIRPSGIRWEEFARAFLLPLAVAAASVVPGWCLASLALGGHHPALRLAVTASAAAALYLPALRWADPRTAALLIDRLRRRSPEAPPQGAA